MDLGKIPKVILSSDLPDTFNAVVKNITEKKTKEGGNSLNILATITSPAKATMVKEGKQTEVPIKDRDTSIMYRIPKALTGRGQGDILLRCIKDGFGTTDTNLLIGAHCEFQRISLRTISPNLPATFRENPRHYPTRKLGQKPL